MEKNVYGWLEKRLCLENTESKSFSIKEMLKEERATAFLLIWPIMEQVLFKGFLHKADIKKFSEENGELYNKIGVEDITSYFYERYQDNEKCHNLIHKETRNYIDKFIKKPYIELNDTDKLAFLLYVVFRYRNNIFHGNKGIRSWCKYTQEIDYCIRFMSVLIDEYEVFHKIVK